MKQVYFFFIFLFASLPLSAQVYKYIGAEEGGKPFGFSVWAILVCLLVVLLFAGIGAHFIILRRQRKISEERIRFFIQTAHDIRTPLTLIKAPLEEIADNETLSENGRENINTSLRNVDALLQLTTNLINLSPEAHTLIQAPPVPQEPADRPTATGKPSPVSTNRTKILIAEGNDDLRKYLSRSLSEEYQVQVCADGKAAFDIIKEYNPQLIISDIVMPEMRGDELCRRIKDDINTSHIPVILLTALSTDQHIIEGLQAGADEYIVKPFNIGVLRATIAGILANRALLRRKYANLELEDETHKLDCINCSSDLDWKFIAHVKQNVEDNMANPGFNVDTLCALLNMSRTSFYNKIKALTDQAPADYVRLIRLKHAARLLKEGKYNITEIAEKTGFNDAKYFREVFKKHFRMSPSQYAKSDEA